MAISSDDLSKVASSSSPSSPQENLANEPLGLSLAENACEQIDSLNSLDSDGTASDKACKTSTESCLTSWQKEGLERLLEVFWKRSPRLKQMLGDLERALVGQRKAEEGVRSVIARDAALALIVGYNRDLFANRERRQIIGEVVGLDQSHIPCRWERGKESAKNFVRRIGFPQEFAGKAFIEERLDIEPLIGKPRAVTLQDYQVEVFQKASAVAEQDNGKAIIELPTGAGKTRVAMETILSWLSKRRENNDTVLWLAHSEELCEQAAQDARRVWEQAADSPQVDLVRFWGKFTKDVRSQQFQNVLLSPDPQILISTPQRILSVLSDTCNAEAKLAAITICMAGLVVIDEAHRGAAPTYKKILKCLDVASPTYSLLGMTATPYRMEYRDPADKGTIELRDIFHQLLEPSQTLQRPYRQALQERDVLSQAKLIEFSTNTTLRIGSITGGIDKAMQKKADIPSRRGKVLPEILKMAQDPDARILYFGPTVSDAQSMAFLLATKGIKAGVVTGNTAPGTRTSMIKDFKQGDLQVLCNCQVLTTGFDAPKVSHVVIARPTISRVLFEQMMGRGLRGPKFGGTKNCSIMICIDERTGVNQLMGYEKYLRVWHEQDQPNVQDK